MQRRRMAAVRRAISAKSFFRRSGNRFGEEKATN
jgi:hypothetical protein